MKTVIYYFTGNSLKIAKDIAEYLDNVELIQICCSTVYNKIDTDVGTIGFVVPTIFSGIPRLAKEFIEELKIACNKPYIFVISTHGDRNGEGIVFDQIEKILKDKELLLSASFSIQMPHNVPQKDHLTTEKERIDLFRNEGKIVITIANTIKNHEVMRKKQNKIKNFLSRVNYNSINGFIKKNPIDRGFYVDESCTGRKICNRICPANNITIDNNKPKWKLENCQVCLACLQWCPVNFIQDKKLKGKGIEQYHHPEIKVNELFSE